MPNYTLVSKEELYSAMRNLYYILSTDLTENKILEDTKKRAERLIEIIEGSYDEN